MKTIISALIHAISFPSRTIDSPLVLLNYWFSKILENHGESKAKKFWFLFVSLKMGIFSLLHFWRSKMILHWFLLLPLRRLNSPLICLRKRRTVENQAWKVKENQKWINKAVLKEIESIEIDKFKFNSDYLGGLLLLLTDYQNNQKKINWVPR